MRFVILRILTHSELGMFHEYRRQGKEGSRQRAINFDGDVVDRVFPGFRDSDLIDMDLKYDTDAGVALKRHWLKRQEKNWRLEGNCPTDKYYGFVNPECLFALQIDSGTRPAVGSWAIFSAGHSVTRRILADAESAGLTSSGMIALHGDEGARTALTLAQARPDLFNAPAIAAANGNSAMITTTTELHPDPERLVAILGSVGHTLPSAIADLVDNAISADATEINVRFGRPDNGHGRWLSIADNGKGMNAATLAEAMRIGSRSEYESNALGKYGYGLKGASWSQTKVFTVVTRRDGQMPHHLTWDTADMAGWKARSAPLEPWEQEATMIAKHGTVVLWKDMRPPQIVPAARNLDPHTAEISSVERHLALVFHRFLEGKAAGRKTVTLSINGQPVAPNNPVGHPLASAYDRKTVRMPAGSADGIVQAQAWLLPSEEELSEYHQKDGPEAVRRARDLIGLHGKRNETQGLFIYRHDRLIKWGGWHDMWETNDEKTKLARVVVDFDKTLDDALKINISKQLVQLPQHLQAEIKKLADVARRDSQKKFRKTPSPASIKLEPIAESLSVREPDVTRAPISYGSGSAPAATPHRPEAAPVNVNPVRTEKFIWKITREVTGGQSLQVSHLDSDLNGLINRINKDPEAIALLSAFLTRLDAAGVQTALLAGRRK